jgi:hypothetical protein
MGIAPTGYETTATERKRSSLAEIAPRAKVIADGLERQKQAGFTREANAEWQRFIGSPEGKATLLKKRNELKDKLESGRAQARGGLTNQELAAQSRNKVYQTYIAAFVKSKNEEDDRRNPARVVTPKGVNGAGASTGSQGPAPKSTAEEVQPNFRGGTNFDKNNPFGNGNVQNDAFNLDRRAGDTFNIAKFRGQVTTPDDVLPMHSFLAVFSPMTWVPNSAIKDGVDSLLTMRCENAILPTINLLQEQNVRRYGFGPVENVAYGVNVGDFTLQFIVDKQARVIDFFEAWMNKIVNRDSFGGANMNNDVGNGKTPYEVAYKDTYACSSVNVFVYDRSQNTVLEYNIYDVFPTGIQSMNFSWSEENSLMKLNVTFSFTDLRIRPKVSVFDQGTLISTVDKLGNEPISVTKDIAIDVGPISDPAAIAAGLPASTLNQPLVIGDATNNYLRNFGGPTVAPATDAFAPEVPQSVQRNALGAVIGVA